MNEEAVKELTKQGCMVERDAAEILNQDDVEQIKNLETTPMYVSKNMVQKLRSKIEAKPEKKQVMTTSGAQVEAEEKENNTEQLQEENEEASDDSQVQEDIYDKKSSNFSSSKTVKIKDSGSRDRKTTKVERIDEKDISKEKKDVPEFLGYYNDRYDKMKKMLMKILPHKHPDTI